MTTLVTIDRRGEEETRIVALAIGATILNKTRCILVEFAVTLGTLEASFVPEHVGQHFEYVLIVDEEATAFAFGQIF